MTTPPALDEQVHDENEEIGLKHGSVSVGTLRSVYGPMFASGFGDTDTLDKVLAQAPDHESLAELRADYYKGELSDRLA
ncbi:MAG: hypothetical protein JWO51_2834 [Rhodospirillales bacterium]|nr:hypothetical protein [Rhodospirillales bacterium]